jgi:hypothetical protein
MSGMKKPPTIASANNYNSKQAAFKKNQEKVFTSPKNWPGISTLNKLLERDQDNEAPKLKILLFESLVAVYTSLLINAFVFYDCSTIWRLLSKQWNEQMWNKLFGGGCQVEYKYRTTSSSIPSMDDENTKLRMKMNAKLGHKLNYAQMSSSPPGSQNMMQMAISVTSRDSSDEKVYIREHFVAPEISMINYFINKVIFYILFSNFSS